MKFITDLPIAARIGAGVALLVVIALVVMLAMRSSGDGTTAVAGGSDEAAIADARLKLEQAKIKPQIEKDGKVWKVMVPSSQKQQAEAALGINARPSSAARPKCTTPGQFATTAQTEKYDVCTARQDIFDQLVGQRGVSNASVVLTEEDSGSITGADKVASASITVYLEPEADVSGADLASLVAASYSALDAERIVIFDGDGNRLWNRGVGTGAAESGGCTLTGAALSDMTTKETAVGSCFEQQLRERFAPIVGGKRNIEVIASVTLNSAAQQKSVREISQGALLKTTIPGQESTQDRVKEYAPNETTTTETVQAGAAIDRLSVSVFLDSQRVPASKESAIRQALLNLVNVDRGDVATVQLTNFAEKATAAGSATGATGAPPADANAGDMTGGGDTADSSAAGNADFVAESEGVSTTILVVGGLLLLVLVAIVGLLMRNSARLAHERKAFEEEFRRDHHAFNNFVQHNADELARDLEAMLGAAPATTTRN